MGICLYIYKELVGIFFGTGLNIKNSTDFIWLDDEEKNADECSAGGEQSHYSHICRSVFKITAGWGSQGGMEKAWNGDVQVNEGRTVPAEMGQNLLLYLSGPKLSQSFL